METKQQIQEQISALADDELSDSQLDALLAALRDPAARVDWDIYHQIGDVLRSDDMAISMRGDFSARVMAQLDAEPTIIAPAAATAARTTANHGLGERLRRLAMPGVTAAAVATAVFVTAPQMLVAKKDVPEGGAAVVVVAPATVAPAVQPVRVAEPAAVLADAPAEARTVSLDQQQGEVLRDPRIDEYLMAHQRFSPSVYSSAQYVRSSAFSGEAGK